MATMRGLLDDDESLAPGLGLLNLMQGANDPMSLLRLTGGPNDGKARYGIGGTPGASPQSAAPPTPPPAPEPVAAPERVTKKDPNLSPTRAGIVAGGMQLIQDASTPSQVPQRLGAMLSRALAAGVPAAVASRQMQAQRDAQRERHGQYLTMLRDPAVADVLGAAGVRLAEQMDPEKGIEYITKLMEEQGKSVVVGDSLVRSGTGERLFRDEDPTMTVGATDRVFARGEGGAPGELLVDQAPVRPTPESMDGTSVAIARALKLDPDNPGAWTDEEAERFNQRLLQDSSSRGTNVSTTVQSGERAGEMALMGGLGTDIIERRREISDQFTTYDMAGQALDLMRSGQVITGLGANIRKNFGRALIAAGVAPQGVKDEVSATQQFLGSARDLTSRLVKRLGSGNGITEKDVAFIESIVGSDISNEPESIIYLLDLQRRAIRADAMRFNQDVQGMEGFSEQAKRNAMLRVPGGEAPRSGGGASAPQNGATREVTLPNGRKQTLTFNNGEWGMVSGNMFYPYRGALP